jgi:hypothetical protein
MTRHRSKRLRTRLRASSGKRWSSRDDEIIRTLYPDYRELQSRLPERSYYAIRNRTRTLGIAPRRHIWTNHEIARLRSLYGQGATRAEITSIFSSLTSHQICGKARHIGLVRARTAPHALGVSPLDAIRKRAAAQGLTLRKLDKVAKTKRYFQQTTRRVDWEHLSRAIEKLGGTIEITWRP